MNYNLRMLQNDVEKHNFLEIVKKIFTSNIDTLNESEKIKILELSLMFINSNDESLFDFGYYIITKYSLDTNDYIPLFEISDKLLNFPILKFLIDKKLIKLDDNIFNEFTNDGKDMNLYSELLSQSIKN